MSDRYQKPSGSAGSKGVNFQIDLLSVFLLNSLKNVTDWKLSTENMMAGKFDDVVLELSDGSAILLQAKHKEKKKITLDHLFSTSSKNTDFSLPKYFFSYLDIKTKFAVRSTIICTNTQADLKVLLFINQHNVSRDSMLYYNESASFFTFNDDILPYLIENAIVYYRNYLRRNDIDETVITEENMKEFLRHLQVYIDYPSGNDLEKVGEKLLSGLQYPGNLFHNVSHRDIHQKVKDWFEQSKGEYLTERRAKAMLCEIKSEKYRLLLKNYRVFFKSNDSSFTDSEKRIFHVVAEGGYLLHLMKVYRSLQDYGTNILYIAPDDTLDVLEQVVIAFDLPQYTHLIIVSPKLSDELANVIHHNIRDTLHNRQYKRVIIVAESNNTLAQRLKLSGSHRHGLATVWYSPTLEDLSEDTQAMLLQKKSVIFQGEEVTLAELFSGYITDDFKKSINADILEKLVKGEKFFVGKKLTPLEEDVSKYYIKRKFQRILKAENANENDMEKRDTISEDNIYDVDEKIVLISDGAGAGKTTVLKNLAVRIKENNPRLWVIRIALNDCTKILRDSLRNRKSTISVQEIMGSRETTKLTNELETIIFSLRGIVVLMLDGIDEISPDYTRQITDMLLQSQEAENIRKIFVTARSHMERHLTTELNITSFSLVPLTQQNQIDLLTYYWAYNLNLEDKSKSKCEQYATTLINTVSPWTRNWQGEVKFASSALHARMLAEVYMENLSKDEMERKLPLNMNMVTLYKIFIEKKRDILLEKTNPSGNEMVNEALMKYFEECLAYHRSLALEVILNEKECVLFSCYQKPVKNEQIKVLNIGIVQKLDNKIRFVHRTFAEYFVAECLVNELKLRNNDAKIQKLLIDKIFLDREFDILRRFVDNFLQEYIPSLSFYVFESYMSFIDDTQTINLIHRLAEEGNTEIIRFILKCINFEITVGKEVSVDYVNSISIEKMNSLNILKCLVALGGINIWDDADRTPLHCAVNGGHLDTVKFLVDMGADVDSGPIIKGTLLHFAARRGDSNIVKFLVKCVSDVNTTNSQGCTALHYAAQSNCLGIVKTLVEYGADSNIVNEEGYTALHFAAARGSFDIVEFLVKHTEDINIADRDGYTALHFAAGRGNFDIVKLLVNQGAEVDKAEMEGYTALHCAIRKENFDVQNILRKYSSNIELNYVEHVPLQLAGNKFNIIEFLVENAANINIRTKECYTALHLAAKEGSFDIVKLLMRHGADIHIANNEGCTALHFAVKSGSFNIVEFLVKCGADIHIVDKEGHTALQFAAETGKSDIVEFLVNSGAYINIANNKGYTALHFAAKSGNLHVVEFLLEHEADIDIANREGFTALQLALKEASHAIVESLVKHGANTNIRNKEGGTALLIPAERGDFRDVRLLVEYGADINIANNEGYTILHFAVKAGFTDVVEFLVNHLADINLATKEGYTALHFAVQKGNRGIIEFLVENKANVNAPNDEGYTAFHVAAERGDFQVVKFLMENDGEINIATNKGYTVLHFAVSKGNRDMVQFLVAHNADINISNSDGYTPLHIAVEKGYFQIVKFLVEKGTDLNVKNKEGYTALHFAAKRGNRNIVESLVKNKAKINIANNQANTALHIAAERGDFQIVKFLVDQNMDVNVTNSDGYTALHFAAKKGNRDIIELLAEHKADINVADSDGCTALHFAAERGDIHVVKALLGHKVGVNVINKKGCTALHFAVKMGVFNVVKLLVDHGMDINIANEDGRTALDVANETKRQDIIEFLNKDSARQPAATGQSSWL